MRTVILNTLAVLATVLVAITLGEGMLRLKNSDQNSYSVEMWRYAKVLKVADAELGHVHNPGVSARLQNVDISINSRGLRGPEPGPDNPLIHRILMLGSSITLGWGVPEDQGLRAVLQQRLGAQTEVLNAGIGNYNAERYVGLFQSRLQDLNPEIIVVHYFIRDAEILPPSTGNWIIRNSQLALMLWQAGTNLVYGRDDLSGLENYYRDMYAPESEGRERMQAALGALAQMAEDQGIQVVLAMMPDIHSLNPYPFKFVHDQMKETAARLGWTYVDLLEGFKGIDDARALYAIPGDPHPNARGHAIMADILTPELQRLIDGEGAR